MKTQALILCSLLTLVLGAAQATIPTPIEELFYCTDGTNGYDLYLAKDGNLQVSPKNTGTVYPGQYKVENDQLTVTIPSLGFAETSEIYEAAKDLLLTFKTKSVFCHAVAHGIGPGAEVYAKCPAIKIVSNLSYEENAFQFYANHMVKRRRWTELPNDTLYGESFGIYLIEGTQVSMFFGDRKDERYLTATINGQQSITVNELEPARGPCNFQL